MAQRSQINSVENHYESLPAKYKSKSHNPNFKLHDIVLPARILICAPSSGFKTNLLMDLLKKRFKGTFEHVVFCVKNKQQPFYELIEDKMGDSVEFFTDDEIPSMDNYDHESNKLIVFDDLVMAGKEVQSQITDYFIRGRHSKWSMVYLSQSFYKTPKTIRSNVSYIFLLKINSKRDLSSILNEIPLSVDNIKELLDIYEYARRGAPTNFLNIDLEKSILKKNYLEILK